MSASSEDMGEPSQDMGEPSQDMPTGAVEDMSTSGEDMPPEQDMAPITCAPGQPWDGSAPAFANRTVETNLEALDAEGVRINGVDFDGDGWTDLCIRRVVNPGDDFSEGGRRAVWLLRNTGMGTFEDVTAASGFVARRDGDVTRGRPIEVAAWADVDNDGDLDAFTATLEPSQDRVTPEGSEVMLNDGDGTFSLGDLAANGARVDGVINRGGVAFTDVDRDGNIDLWVGRGSGPNGPEQDNLYTGDGAGGLALATTEWGLRTRPWASLSDLNQALAHTNSWGVNACDLNGDGAPELLSASYGRAPNHLWQQVTSLQGTRYANRSIASGYAFDDDQDWTDNESARCHCQLNPQAEGCEGVPAPELIRCQTQADVFRWNHQYDREPFRLGGNSGTTVCADLDNDGDLDLLTSEIVHWDVGSSSDPSQLLYNTGERDVRFERPGNEATGLVREHASRAWDDGDITAAAFDFDNDGRLDVYIGSTDYPGTRGLLYHQQPDGAFAPVPIDLGIDHKSSHGLAVADFDNDGDLDLVAGHSRARCSSGDHCYMSGHARYFENLVGQDNHWVQLDLEGAEGTNRAAIGAQITVEAGDLVLTHEIDGGHGHYGIQHDLRAHFGLGDACEATVTIRWPDAAGTKQTFTVLADQRYTVRQGEAPVLRGE